MANARAFMYSDTIPTIISILPLRTKLDGPLRCRHVPEPQISHSAWPISLGGSGW